MSAKAKQYGKKGSLTVESTAAASTVGAADAAEKLMHSLNCGTQSAGYLAVAALVDGTSTLAQTVNGHDRSTAVPGGCRQPSLATQTPLQLFVRGIPSGASRGQPNAREKRLAEQEKARQKRALDVVHKKVALLSYPRVYVALPRKEYHDGGSLMRRVASLLCGLLHVYLHHCSRDIAHPLSQLLFNTLLHDQVSQGQWLGRQDEATYVVVCCGPFYYRLDVLGNGGGDLASVDYVTQQLEEIAKDAARARFGVERGPVKEETQQLVALHTRLALLSCLPSGDFAEATRLLRNGDGTGCNALSLDQLDQGICTVVIPPDTESGEAGSFSRGGAVPLTAASLQLPVDLCAMMVGEEAAATAPPEDNAEVCAASTWLRSGLLIHALDPTDTRQRAGDKLHPTEALSALPDARCAPPHETCADIIVSAHSLLAERTALAECVSAAVSEGLLLETRSAAAQSTLIPVLGRGDPLHRESATGGLTPSSLPRNDDAAEGISPLSKKTLSRRSSLGESPQVVQTSWSATVAPRSRSSSAARDNGSRLGNLPRSKATAPLTPSKTAAEPLLSNPGDVPDQREGTLTPLRLWLPKPYRQKLLEAPVYLRPQFALSSLAPGSRWAGGVGCSSAPAQRPLELPEFCLAVIGAVFRVLVAYPSEDTHGVPFGPRRPNVVLAKCKDAGPSTEVLLYDAAVDEWLRIISKEAVLGPQQRRYASSVVEVCQARFAQMIAADCPTPTHPRPAPTIDVAEERPDAIADVRLTQHALPSMALGGDASSLPLWTLDTVYGESSVFGLSCLQRREAPHAHRRSHHPVEFHGTGHVVSYTLVGSALHQSTGEQLMKEIDSMCQILGQLRRPA